MFNELYLKLEESNRRGKTRDLFRKTGNIKGIFCPKMGTINNRNGGNLVDIEEIKKRWKEYAELYKKDIKELITMIMWSATWIQTFWRVKSSGP